MKNSTESLGPVAESEKYYEQLLEKALATIPESGAVMVLGPLFIKRPHAENLELFEKAQKDLIKQGNTVFDQRAFLDNQQTDAPFRFDIKFPMFFQKLIESGKLSACYLMDDWENSEGTVEEVFYCKQAGVPVYKL